MAWRGDILRFMGNYRRRAIGRTVFFTVATHHRRPLLTGGLGRQCLRAAILNTREERPFSIVALVLLPDHLHTIWELPQDDADFSGRWRSIRATFSKLWKRAGGIWQRRFYEHTCRDETDLKRCVDYIHINPVKHGLVRFAREWPWSTFHRFVKAGEYHPDWGDGRYWRGDEFRNFE